MINLHGELGFLEKESVFLHLVMLIGTLTYKYVSKILHSNEFGSQQHATPLTNKQHFFKSCFKARTCSTGHGATAQVELPKYGERWRTAYRAYHFSSDFWWCWPEITVVCSVAQWEIWAVIGYLVDASTRFCDFLFGRLGPERNEHIVPVRAREHSAETNLD